MSGLSKAYLNQKIALPLYSQVTELSADSTPTSILTPPGAGLVRVVRYGTVRSLDTVSHDFNLTAGVGGTESVYDYSLSSLTYTILPPFLVTSSDTVNFNFSTAIATDNLIVTLFFEEYPSSEVGGGYVSVPSNTPVTVVPSPSGFRRILSGYGVSLSGNLPAVFVKSNEATPRTVTFSLGGVPIQVLPLSPMGVIGCYALAGISTSVEVTLDTAPATPATAWAIWKDTP